ncbi:MULTISPECIES: arylsulfatase [unclassified Lentimonas]|uniref:sulfatase family protein n=1 Tax=unclassified Lentimonas TaxID=2630993 RepID=UPI0013239253|nr:MULTISPECIES: arylsulfatase [unclassified Lentimonas]CAA6677641.1 Choline-sulfatase (EC [Lentimonas sp. CC4]CAA6684904.1 Choline-sulfatase (EC [Lentimonas sp. CC6]CAA7077983.1 Choline-sulfatase (EC [Lentimonas sp. CC4]CAA7169904.1 Choline-sulfatase (EC [Lentimonas sp. CC21]CAA7181440.1 Choline-sulfatase (EC [Lentimonas sp. CC8]
MNIKNLLAPCLSIVVTAIWAVEQPNVVIIYGDDVGYGDVGVYGSEMIPTPNIDQLAGEGLVFTDGHCAAATCTPSRYSMLTGIHGFRDNVSILPPNAPLSISTEILTLPKLFKQAGYATGVVGKWHLGIGQKGVKTDWNGAVKPGPMEIGFDSSFLLPSTNDRVPCVYLDGHYVVNLDPSDPLYVGKSPGEVNRPGSTQYPDAKKNKAAMTYYQSTHGHNHSVINGIGRIGYMAGGKAALWDDETMADVFVQQAKEYIAAHKDEPFFLYFASQDIHVPRAPHPRFQGKTELGYRGDAMVQFDWSTGEILKALETYGLTDNTIVIFSSDNGPVYDDGYDDGTTVKKSGKEVDGGHDGSGMYRGGKYQIYEGGTRVPFIVRWPAKIMPGTSDALVNQIDFIASFAALLNLEVPADEARDSRNSLAAFLGNDSEGLPFAIQEAGRTRALRVGQWKYIADRKVSRRKLYNLAEDPSEQNNLITAHPEKAATMDAQLKQLMASDGVRDSQR